MKSNRHHHHHHSDRKYFNNIWKLISPKKNKSQTTSMSTLSYTKLDDEINVHVVDSTNSSAKTSQLGLDQQQEEQSCDSINPLEYYESRNQLMECEDIEEEMKHEKEDDNDNDNVNEGIPIKKMFQIQLNHATDKNESNNNNNNNSSETEQIDSSDHIMNQTNEDALLTTEMNQAILEDMYSHDTTQATTTIAMPLQKRKLSKLSRQMYCLVSPQVRMELKDHDEFMNDKTLKRWKSESDLSQLYDTNQIKLSNDITSSSHESTQQMDESIEHVSISTNDNENMIAKTRRIIHPSIISWFHILSNNTGMIMIYIGYICMTYHLYMLISLVKVMSDDMEYCWYDHRLSNQYRLWYVIPLL